MYKRKIILFSCVVAMLLLAGNLGAQYDVNPEYSKAGFWEVENSGREVYNFNLGWRFHKGEAEGAESADFDDSGWPVVNCPHGLEYNTTEASGSINYQGPAWYRKHFRLPEGITDKSIKIHFEAVMGKSKVWLNGHMLTEHYGGYLPFIVELNEHLIKDGMNVLAVWTDNSDDPTYPPGKEQSRLDFSYFGGIYRDVWLLATNDLYISNPIEQEHVAGGGVFTHVKSVSKEKAEIFVKTGLKNDASSSRKGNLKLRILDPDGKESAAAEKRISVKSGKSAHLEFTLEVQDPELWSPWSPNLYRIEVSLVNESGEIIDGVAVKTGLRTIEFRGKDGFYLNNEPYPGKLMGVNRHQDHAYVGNAIPNNGQWRDAVLLKKAGVDVIRAAHYPADPAFMDALDALGIFYIEATPGWHFYDAGIFEDRVYRDIRHMVRRIRNYASVLLWESILNETFYPPEFAERAHEIVHEEYPYYGAYTVCDHRAGGQEHFDVVYEHDYNADYASETRNYFTREFGDNVDDFNAQNSPSRVARAWGEEPMLVQARTYADGDFDDYTTMESIHSQPKQFVGGTLWCGFDHQRGYACHPFYGGLTDVFRQPKYSYYLWASQREVDQGYKPMVYIANEMTPFSGADVTVFTNCEEVRLTLHDGQQVLQKVANPTRSVRLLTPHGQPNSRKVIGSHALPHPIVTFEDVYYFKELKSMHRGGKKYEAGILVEGLIDGKVVASQRKTSAKRPTRLQLSMENQDVPLTANGSDFVLVVASMVDERGTVKRLHEDIVKFEVTGEGAIIGDESIDANPKQLSWGTAPILIRSTNTPGEIRIKASLLYEGINSPEGAELIIESIPGTDKFIQTEIGSETGALRGFETYFTSEDELHKENEKLKKELIQLKLKEEERNQLDFDENR